ncbi:MAG: DUF2071 domain-containing protein [Candidatus Rokubacteria bacterium]|nr:DUF2071 domain-containing protein [Candidatus Rokubacteria bacterium]
MRLAATAASAIEPGALPPADHRPWPVPREPWVMAQTWERLLFVHWPVAPAALAGLLPPGLALHTRDGHAWLAVTPFHLTGLRARGLPPVPGLSRFHELNVRTYVIAGGKPGVWFLSLDAESAIAVAAARRLYHLPYFHARFAETVDGGRVRYASRRVHPGAPAAELEVVYAPVAPPAESAPGSLEWWLTERYCLYTVDDGRLLRAEIHHAPWPLQRAEATFTRNTMTAGHGVHLEGPPPLLHYAQRLDVVVWPPAAVAA